MHIAEKAKPSAFLLMGARKDIQPVKPLRWLGQSKCQQLRWFLKMADYTILNFRNLSFKSRSCFLVYFCFLIQALALIRRYGADINPKTIFSRPIATSVWICKSLIFRHVTISEIKICVSDNQISSKLDDSRLR